MVNYASIRLREVQQSLVEDFDTYSVFALFKGLNEARQCLEAGMTSEQAYQCGRVKVLLTEKRKHAHS